MIPPSDRVPEQCPDWFLVATEACGSGTPDLGFFLGAYVFIGIIGVGLMSGGLRVIHEIGGVPSTLVDVSGLFWPNSFTSGASFGP